MKSMNGTVMAREVKQGKLIEIPKLAVSKRFGMYKDEEKKAVRDPDNKKDEVLERIREAWRRINPDHNMHGKYVEACREINRLQLHLNCSSKDVERFSVALAEFQDEKDFSVKAGTFLSALINMGRDSDYTIHTGHLTKGIEMLGFKNTKNVIVRGNAFDGTGAWMKSGLLVVEGSVVTVGVAMDGGRIIVNGDSGEIGDGMRSGVIIVKGNSLGKVGKNMTGGEIHVEGEICSIGELFHGKIFHKGKLIVDK